MKIINLLKKMLRFQKTLFKFFILFTLIFLTLSLFSQKEFDAYQITGQVMSTDSITPISFVHIKTSVHKHIHTTDWFGYYTIVVRPNDKVTFSALGYKSKTVQIDENFKSNRLILNIYLETDTLMLPHTDIYSLPSYKQFLEMVAKLDVPDDDYERAKKNLSPEMIQLFLDKIEMDYSMNYRHYVYREVQKLYYKGQMPPNPLFNVFNWKKFIEAIRRGDFKSKR